MQKQTINTLESRSDCFLIGQFLITRFVREGKLSNADRALLFSSVYESVLLLEKNPQGYKSWSEFYELTSKFVYLIYGFPQTKYDKLLVQYIIQLNKVYKGYLLNPRQYLGYQGNPRFKRFLRDPYRLLSVRPAPPKPFVAVGYSDKGTRRNPSVDGTPSMRELAGDENTRLSWLNAENDSNHIRFAIDRLAIHAEESARIVKSLIKFNRWKRGSLLD